MKSKMTIENLEKTLSSKLNSKVIIISNTEENCEVSMFFFWKTKEEIIFKTHLNRSDVRNLLCDMDELVKEIKREAVKQNKKYLTCFDERLAELV